LAALTALQDRLLAAAGEMVAPGGLFAQMLAALPARREAQMLARIAECAVNPCVPLTLHFASEA
ncbi:MAG: hypothetical protein B7Y95_23435, partial [Rhizobiales bacterium 32-66-11]